MPFNFNFKNLFSGAFTEKHGNNDFASPTGNRGSEELKAPFNHTANPTANPTANRGKEELKAANPAGNRGINEFTNPLFPQVVDSSKQSGCVGKDGELQWLAEKIKQSVNVSSELHRGLEVMFHIGRYQDSDAWSQLWSTVCVVDFLTRFFPKQGEIANDFASNSLDHPMRSVFSVVSEPGNIYFAVFFQPEREWWSFLEQQYLNLNRELKTIPGNSGLLSFSRFKVRFYIARKILTHFSSVCGAAVVDSHNTSVSTGSGGIISLPHVCEHMWVIDTILSGILFSELEKKGGIENLVSKESVFRVLHQGKSSRSLCSQEQNTATEEEQHSLLLDQISVSLSDSGMSESVFIPRASKEDGSLCTIGGDTGSGWRAPQSTPVQGQAQNSWDLRLRPRLPPVPGTVELDTDNHSKSKGDSKRGEGTQKKISGAESVDEQKKKGKRGRGRAKPGNTTTQKGKRGRGRAKPGNTTTQNRKKRITRLRRGGTGIAISHYEEDVTIQVPIVATLSKKPMAQLQPISHEEDDNMEKMFDDHSTRFHADSRVLPIICVETFSDKEGKLVRGPYKQKVDETTHTLEIGSPLYLNMTGKKRLTNVLCCATSSAYIYFFRHANYKPHFVAGRDVATEYRNKLSSLDIDLRVIPHWKLKEPVKVLSDRSITEGLREGFREESDFVFVSEETSLFRNYFGEMAEIPFPTTQWMEFFDKNTSPVDKQGRNFKFGHHDCGWGREGCQEEAYESHHRGIEFLMARPQLSGDHLMLATLGPLVDRATMLMDAVCFENGQRLMNDEQRDRLFGAELREKTNSIHSRFEAYTVVRQPLGRACDVTGGKVNFPCTSRHVDGPNCNRPGYTTTGVFSFLCVWKEIVYRTTIIMYTRESCGNYMWRNFHARKLRLKLWDYIVERNGGVHYYNFSLSDNMQYLRGFPSFNTQKNPIFYLQPEPEMLSDTFFQRNPESRWLSVDPGGATNPSWTTFTNKGQYKRELRILALPEFFCRYGYVSSFAFQINRFIGHLELPTPPEMIHQLIYIALLEPSPPQFFYVMEILIEEKRDLLSLYAKSKTETGNKTDISLFRRFQEICLVDLQDEQMTSGPYQRYQGQPTSKSYNPDQGEKGSASIRRSIENIPRVIKDVASGACLDNEGVLNKRPGTILTYVGDVGSLSCAPLLLFIGEVKGEYAVMTAKQSMLNTKSKNSYWDSLQSFMESNCPEGASLSVTKKMMTPIFKSIAKSWNTGSGSVENGCCALWRKLKRYDVFFHGQDLYNIDDQSYDVKVKVFGSSNWEIKKFD